MLQLEVIEDGFMIHKINFKNKNVNMENSTYKHCN